MEIGIKEKKILDTLQREIPPCTTPFTETAESLGMEEDEFLKIIRSLKEKGIIRFLGPIFDPPSLGYNSTLCAISVPENIEEAAVEFINSHPGVTHNYKRTSHYNMWFTLTLPPEHSTKEHLNAISRALGDVPSIHLPAQEVFKIGVVLSMEDGKNFRTKTGITSSSQNRKKSTNLSYDERKAVIALQHGLPLCSRPFAELAEKYKLDERFLISSLKNFLEQGIARRCAAVLRPHRAGYKINAMLVWNMPDDDARSAGRALAEMKCVTHCYLRARDKDWRYNLYAMTHFKTEDELEQFTKKMCSSLGMGAPEILKTVKEWKKTRIEFFVHDFDSILQRISAGKIN